MERVASRLHFPTKSLKTYRWIYGRLSRNSLQGVGGFHFHPPDSLRMPEGYARTMNNYKEKQRRNQEYRKKLIANPTKAELIFKKKLGKTKMRSMFQKGFIGKGNHVIVDFYLPKHKLCIEIDGGYHNTPKQQKRDENRDHYLTNVRGFRVVHISNEEAIKISHNKISERIGISKRAFKLG